MDRARGNKEAIFSSSENQTKLDTLQKGEEMSQKIHGSAVIAN